MRQIYIFMGYLDYEFRQDLLQRFFMLRFNHACKLTCLCFHYSPEHETLFVVWVSFLVKVKLCMKLTARLIQAKTTILPCSLSGARVARLQAQSR